MNRSRIWIACAYLLIGCVGTPLMAAESPSVQPPRAPHMSREPEDGAYEKGPPLKQSEALQDELMALTQGTIEERVEKLKRKVLKDLIFVEGGTFSMGDFGSTWSKEGLYYTFGLDNKPPHKVTLTGYSLSRYKTTYAEFDVFADATQQQRAGMGW